jgi:hypothetical protein
VATRGAQDFEPLSSVRAFANLGSDHRHGFHESGLKLWSLVAAIGGQPLQKREGAKQCRDNQRSTVTILDIRRVDDRMKQETYRIDEDMSLLAFDFLPRVVAVRVNPRPPFSALFTLWLSITQAVGLASRPICSRHLT